jgi:hypothetical protein
MPSIYLIYLLKLKSILHLVIIIDQKKKNERMSKKQIESGEEPKTPLLTFFLISF